MDLWQRLLSVKVPGDTSLVSLEAGLRGWGPLLWAVAIALLGGIAVVAFYLLEPRRLGRVRRLSLATVRILALLLLCLFLFRPLQLTAVFKGERPRSVVLLADNSQSMTLQDRRITAADKLRVALACNAVPLDTPLTDQAALQKVSTSLPVDPSRVELLKNVLQHPGLRLREKLGQVGPLREYLFGSRLRRVAEPKGEKDDPLLKALDANDPETALSVALDELLTKTEGDPPAAVVLCTDGWDRDGRSRLLSVARDCQRLGVPLHIYGVGSTEAGTLHLSDVVAPELLFAQDTVSIPVRWQCLGLKQGTVKITATLGGKEVASKEVAVKEGDDLRDTLTFTPEKGATKDERLPLVVRIQAKDNPVFRDEVIRQVRLLDTKVKVLYVENIARWEFQFIQRALLRDRRVEARFLLREGDKETLRSGPPFLENFPSTRKDLFAFDLIILGDVPFTFIGAEKAAWIKDFVNEGGGLVHIAGRVHAPASFQGTVLEEVLPVEFQPLRFTTSTDLRTQGFQPVLTRYGQREPMLMLAETIEDNQKLWSELPSIYWHYPVTRVRAGALPLLAHPTQKLGDDPMPLLVHQHYGKGQVLFSGFEESWRWRLNAQDQYFARYWGQIVYKLGMRGLDGTRRTQLSLDRSEVFLGHNGWFYARLLDANFKPLTQKSVNATLERMDAGPGEKRTQQIELHAEPGAEGDYRASVFHDKAGRYILRVQGSEPATLEYRVEVPQQHELAQRGLASETLELVAQASGGRLYREEQLPELAQNVKPQNATFTDRPVVPLLNPLTFLIFLGLLTVEWVMRKFSNLS
jgi:hypothetical protein